VNGLTKKKKKKKKKRCFFVNFIQIYSSRRMILFESEWVYNYCYVPTMLCLICVWETDVRWTGLKFDRHD